MIIDAAGAFLIVIVNLVFWALIFVSRSFTHLARSYFGWAFFITLWAFGYGITLSGLFPYHTTLIWNKYCQAMATMIGPFFFKFSTDVVGKYQEHKKIFKFYLAFGVLNALALFFSPYYVAGLWSFGPYKYQPLGGPLYFIFTLFFMWCTMHSYLVVASQYNKVRGIQKKHTALFLIATGIAYFGGISLFFQGFRLPVPTTGVYLIVAYVIIIGYSIYRYKFMDIEVIIKRTLVFAGLFLMVMAVVAMVTAVTQGFLNRFLNIGVTGSMILSGLISIAFYDPSRRLLINLTDRYLFQKKFDYRRLLKEASQEMAMIKSLKQLSRLIVGFLILKGRITSVSAYTRDDPHSDFTLQAQRPRMGQAAYSRLRPESPLLWYLEEKRKAVEIHELQSELSACRNADKRGKLEALVHLLKEMRVEAVVPSYLGRMRNAQGKSSPELRSILLLGAKKSDESYNQEDLDVFYTLAQESAIAIENARLYDEHIRRERNKILGDMTGSVAHEVRHPLSYIQYAAHFIQNFVPDVSELARDPGIPESQRRKLAKISENLPKYLSSIKTGTGRVSSIVQTLEGFAKRKQEDPAGDGQGSAAETKAAFQPIDFKFLMNLVLGEVRFKYRSTHQFLEEIEIQAERDLPALFGDQNGLIQVFMNLISNAHDAMLKSTQQRLVIKAYPDPEDRGFVHLEFQDTGGGIPEPFKQKVWEHLFTTKAKEGGSGFGLSWCKNIVEEIHEGKIWFESTEGVGTVFHLKIPAWKESLSREIA